MPWRRVVIGAAVALVGAGLVTIAYVVWNDAALPFWRDGDAGVLRLYGNVERREVDLGFNVGGRLAAMLFEEGDRVARGQLLARLERERFVDTVAAAKARVDRQRAVLRELETGSRPEEIAQARARVAAAEAALRNAERQLERQRRLAREDFASQARLDEALTARDEAVARLEEARKELDLLVEGPRQEEIEAARAELAALEAELALARENLADTLLYAPSKGVILSRILEPGAIVREGEPVYTLTLDRPVWVRAYVTEPDLGLLEPGTAARVITDSRPEQPYEGQIGFISPVAEFTPKSVYTPDTRTSLVYRFRVIVPDPGPGLRQGMPVTVEIPIGAPSEQGSRARTS